MRAMVFAAGLGLRLRPMTETIPKALIPVGGRPMIEYPLLLLRHHGIREVIINLNHLGHSIEEYLGSGKRWGLEIQYSKEKDLLDTGGGLLKARPLLDTGPFIVINSDVMIDLPINELAAYHHRKKTIATLVLRPDPLADRYGPIETDQDGKVELFLEHQAPHPPPGPLTKHMFTGVQILEPKVFDYMDGTEPFGMTRVTYPRMLHQGETLYGFTYRGFWRDLGTPEGIREAEEKLARGEVKLHYLE